VSKGRSFEYLRLTSLGVIGALVKVDDPKVIDFLIKTEIIPLCLRIMERGTELSQTVATFIIQKILMDEEGLKYLCMKPERYLAVSNVLDFMV
jgi:CCR4-NOT transcription complex subunit 9